MFQITKNRVYVTTRDVPSVWTNKYGEILKAVCLHLNKQKMQYLDANTSVQINQTNNTLAPHADAQKPLRIFNEEFPRNKL